MHLFVRISDNCEFLIIDKLKFCLSLGVFAASCACVSYSPGLPEMYESIISIYLLNDPAYIENSRTTKIWFLIFFSYIIPIDFIIMSL